MAALPVRPRWSAAVFWQKAPKPNWKCADVIESPVAVRMIRLSHGILLMSRPSEGGMLSFSASARLSLSDAVSVDSSPAGHEVSVGCGVGVLVSVGTGDGVGVSVGSGDGVAVVVGSGDGVGVSVGNGVGDAVTVGRGDGLGVSVGSGVGVSVGTGDGAIVAVGSGDGAVVSVGEGDGDGLARSASTSASAATTSSGSGCEKSMHGSKNQYVWSSTTAHDV